MPRRRAQRLLAVLGAVMAALAIWVIAVPVAGADLTVRQSGTTQPVGLAAVIGASLLAGLAGWALLALLERRAPRRADRAPAADQGNWARRRWTAIALGALVLSLAGPLPGGVGTATTVTLAGMHLAVGAVLILGLRRTA